MITLQHRKKIAVVVLTIVATCVLSFNQGCAGAAPEPLESARDSLGFPGNYELAVIRTSDYADPTYIEFYDKSLNLVTTVEYPYVCLENLVSAPSISDGFVYMPHRGNYYGRNGSQVVGISIQTGEVQEYEVGGNSLTTTKDRIFVESGSGANTKITQIDKKSGETKEAIVGGVHVHALATNGETIVAAQGIADKDDEKLLFFKDVSYIEREVELTGLGYPRQITHLSNDRFYFGATLYNASNETFAYTLNYYSMSDDILHTVLSYAHSLSFIVENDTYLFVATDDVNAVQGNEILVVDKTSEEVVKTCPVSFLPQYMSQHGDYLYLLGYNIKTDERCLAQYRIDGSDVTYVTEINLSNTHKGWFASGMFFED
jgi:hypothetical protein